MVLRMNDESHSLEPADAAYFFRDSVAAYVHYRDDGTIAALVVDEIGVGEYDGASWIPAENSMAFHPDAIKRCAKRKTQKRAFIRAQFSYEPPIHCQDRLGTSIDT